MFLFESFETNNILGWFIFTHITLVGVILVGNEASWIPTYSHGLAAPVR